MEWTCAAGGLRQYFAIAARGVRRRTQRFDRLTCLPVSERLTGQHRFVHSASPVA